MTAEPLSRVAASGNLTTAPGISGSRPRGKRQPQEGKEGEGGDLNHLNLWWLSGDGCSEPRPMITATKTSIS